MTDDCDSPDPSRCPQCLREEVDDLRRELADAARAERLRVAAGLRTEAAAWRKLTLSELTNTDVADVLDGYAAALEKEGN